MNLWKRKLLAYLHDPPHKPFQIVGHEDARGPLLRAVNLTEAEIDDWHRRPDWWAAAADRFPFPRSDVMRVDWKTDGQLEFRHPLSGQRFVPDNQPRARSATGESWVESALRGLPTDDAGWKQKFFRVWRLWPERCAREKNPLLAYLVADTRIPDHTLWHHNGLVSALDAVGEKPAFLLLQIGPVQEFIAQARKTLDLWSGSYLLSFLISKALATIALEIGPDCVLYPNLRGSPLLDWWWSREPNLFPPMYFELGKGRLHENELLVPSLPHRFLALVPAGDHGRMLAHRAAEAVRSLWQDIARAVHEDIRHRLSEFLDRGEFPAWDAHWDHTISRFPLIEWTIKEWLPESEVFRLAEEHETPPLPGGWRQHPLRHVQLWRDMIPDTHRESWHGTRNDSFAWSLHVALTDWQFAALRNARRFEPWPPLRAGTHAPPKDDLNGRDEVLGGPNRGGFWVALREKYGGAQKGQFKGRQLYGALTVIKRLWSSAYLNGVLKWAPCRPDFESIHDIAGKPRAIALIDSAIRTEPEEKLPPNAPTYYAVLRMDGDDMGQWVSGTKAPALEKVLAKKAWEYFTNGRDSTGGWKPTEAQVSDGFPASLEKVRRPLSPGFHAALSEAISNFGLYCARQIVEAFEGQLLFSGGDDVLAMLPAHNAIDCAFALHCAFRGELPQESPQRVREVLESLFEFREDAPGFIRCRKAGSDEAHRPNWYLLVPGTRATASIGIAIGHVRSPMQDTINAALEAEATAKAVPGKGAFCLRILKRSGESVEFAAQLASGVPRVWAELEANEDRLSFRFPYRLLQVLSPLLARTGTMADEGWEPRWNSELLAAVEAELRHVHFQQNESPGSASQRRLRAKEQAQRWVSELVGDPDSPDFKPALSPRGFLHFWMAWAFARRLQTQRDDD